MSTKIERKISKNKNYRILTERFEMKKITNKYLNTITEDFYIEKLYRCNKYASISRIKNMCTQTGRYRGILSYFKLSRIKLKDLASLALLPGLRRSS